MRVTEMVPLKTSSQVRAWPGFCPFVSLSYSPMGVLAASLPLATSSVFLSFFSSLSLSPHPPNLSA
jgi:hypothetical protein